MRRTRLLLRVSSSALLAVAVLGIASPSTASAQIVLPPPPPVLQPIPPTAGPPVAVAAPAPAPAPAGLPAVPPGSGGGRRVVYSNSAQRVWLVGADGVAIDSWLVSGRRGVPRPGTYSVFSRSPVTTGQGGRVTMQYMVRFARGRTLAIGFHSIPLRRNGTPIQSVEQLGTFRSAGCVRQRVEDAAKLWDFAAVGTTVVVVA